MVSYARWVEPHWVRWFHRELPIRNLPDALVGKTLVQASDLHVGPRVSDGYLMETFDRIGELEPDVFVVTGDFVTFRGPNRFEKLARVLEHTPRGRIATLGVLGNHDYGHHWEDATTAERVSERVTGAGFTLLRNETVDVMGLAVTGMDDLWARQIDVAGALAGIGEEARLVLCHHPEGVDESGWQGYVGWVLSGHTHGGQCKPPFLPPPLLPVRNRRYVAGEVGLADGRRVYINRGLGHLLKARFNVRPEVTVFTLARG